MTTVEALKAVYTSLGGELTDTYENIADGIPVADYVIIPDVISAISARAASAGIELPKTTASDNGKILTVVNGAWDKADPDASLPEVTAEDNGDVLTVVDGAWGKATPAFKNKITGTLSGTTVTLSNGMTGNDIFQMVENGIVPILEITSSTDTTYYVYQKKLNNVAVFETTTQVSNNTATISSVEINANASTGSVITLTIIVT